MYIRKVIGRSLLAGAAKLTTRHGVAGTNWALDSRIAEEVTGDIGADFRVDVDVSTGIEGGNSATRSSLHDTLSIDTELLFAQLGKEAIQPLHIRLNVNLGEVLRGRD